MLLELFLAFMTALFTGVTLRTPPSALLWVGFTGMAGWAAGKVLSGYRIPELVTAVSGAIVVGILAEILARVQKHPVTVYIVSGIIPLVPGSIAYRSMTEFLAGRLMEGIATGFRAFLIATYLAAGLAVAPLVTRSVIGFISRCRGISGKQARKR